MDAIELNTIGSQFRETKPTKAKYHPIKSPIMPLECSFIVRVIITDFQM